MPWKSLDGLGMALGEYARVIRRPTLLPKTFKNERNQKLPYQGLPLMPWEPLAGLGVALGGI